MITLEEIRQKMQQFNKKPIDIAKDCGIGRNSVSQWLSGKKGLSRIAQAMFFYYFKTLKK